MPDVAISSYYRKMFRFCNISENLRDCHAPSGLAMTWIIVFAPVR